MAFTQKWLTAWLFDNVLESDGNMANKCHDTGYPHDGRADNAAYRHDRRADKRRYRHDREIDIQNVKCLENGYILS